VPPDSRLPLRIVAGTAGHIDHGKTALVRALTGIDTDRLPEEKARGITIDLGFAHFTTAAGDTLAVVDVPGHERFVRAMVAGASGIDLGILVIAADEGPMPQTREHLDICGLLGIRRAVVALTKVDLVSEDWLALVTDDVRALLRGTALETAAVVPCSAVSGAGLPALRAEIERLASAAAARATDGPLRLPLDRVFTVKGFGTVATGTLASGRLREGDDVEILPAAAGAPRTAKVRGIEAHGQKRIEAFAGQRTAVNLHAVERDDLARGAVLVHPGQLQASAIVDVELDVLRICPAPLGDRTPVLFHALTTQENALVVLHEPGAIEPGARGLAQLHLARPVALLPGDRFILRGFQPLPGHGTTLAGGRVVRVLAPKRRRRDGDNLARLQRMGAAPSFDTRVALEIEAAGTAGLDRAGLRARLGEGHKAIERAVEALLTRRAAITVHRELGAVIAAAALDRVQTILLEALDRFHAEHPLAPGIAREELRTMRAEIRTLDPRVFAVAVVELARRGAVEVDGAADRLRRAGFSAAPAEAAQEGLVARVRSVYTDGGLAPPWSHELAARVGAPANDASDALEILVRRGDIVRVKPDLCFDRAAVDALAARLRAHLTAQPEITPQQWKELSGVTRKYGIPLAEHFDAEKLTLRVGDVRRLRQKV
jgi:selenocysteine-specific elongation factor